MSKIKTITVSNLKAISNFTGIFDGATAIIMGGNNKGKTTFCRSLFDRIRGIKPEMIVKQSQKEGFAECELTTGEKFRWDFKEGGKEKLTYITDKAIKMPASRSICDRFFPETFDVDKFLNDTPAKQRKTLQDLVGLDFTDIDERYTEAYKERTSANTRYQDAKTIFEATIMPERVDQVEIAPLIEEKDLIREELSKVYTINKGVNDEARKNWQNKCDELRKEIQDFNELQSKKRVKYNVCRDALLTLQNIGYGGSDVELFLNSIANEIESDKIYEPLPEPVYIIELPDDTPLKEIEVKIEQAHEANVKVKLWSDWDNLRLKKVGYYNLSIKADEKVKSIEQERNNLIKTAKMPEGFSFSDDGIMYNNLPFNRQQLSSSGIYIAALKLASMNIGDVRTLHFDASFLDKNSLFEIEKWANENDLQLFIERPDFDGGEIKYEIINESE